MTDMLADGETSSQRKMNELAELIRRNPDYVKEACKFKKKWDSHFRVFPDNVPLNERDKLWRFDITARRFEVGVYNSQNLSILTCPKGHANPLYKTHPNAKRVISGYSEKMKTFLESWNLTRFLDPDNLKDETFVEDLIVSPTQLRVTKGQWLKPRADRLYIEIRPGMKASIFRTLIKNLLEENMLPLDTTDTRNRPDSFINQLKIYDLKVNNSRLSFSRIAKTVYGEMTAQDADRAKKAFEIIKDRIENVKNELP